MKRRYATLDVFTDRPFAGNPLAVVLEADGLDPTRMQSIAREFNLSETVFVFPPSGKPEGLPCESGLPYESRAKLRIFTPGTELPFAGHPTVGTAVLLAHLDGANAKPSFVLEETVGPVPCRVRNSRGDAGYAQFDVPRLPVKEAADLDVAAMTAALGLQAADSGDDRWPAERWSAGNPFTIVPVRGLDAMKRCRVDLARFDAAFRSGGKPAAFLICRETSDRQNQLHARMFSPSMGIIEDPATGSAAAALAGYLAVHGGYAEGEHSVRIEQGVEMGRPSLMELSLRMKGGQLAGAAIGGEAVIVSEGSIQA